MNILITGGASGLGEAITKKLANNQNNTVYFTYYKSKIKAEKIQAEYKNSIGIKCDFKSPDDVASIINKIESLALDALINNAYSSQISPTHFHKTSSEKFLSDFNDNIIPTIEITKGILRKFRKQKHGKIITILTASLANVPPIGYASYVASKSYLEKLTKVWASENAKFNISSNTISPSFMHTSLTNDTDERVIEQITENHPLKKLLTVEEVAEAADFLIKASNHINGIDLMMNAATSIR